MKKCYKDEVNVEFSSALGIVLGETCLHKKDAPFMARFGRDSKHTNVYIDNKRVKSKIIYNPFNPKYKGGKK